MKGESLRSRKRNLMERKKENSVTGSMGTLTLAKFMVSLEAPITWEPLVMLGEKLSEEGTTKKNLISLSSPAQSQYPTQQRHTNTAFAFRLAAQETPAAHGIVRVKGKA